MVIIVIIVNIDIVFIGVVIIIINVLIQLIDLFRLVGFDWFSNHI